MIATKKSTFKYLPLLSAALALLVLAYVARGAIALPMTVSQSEAQAKESVQVLPANPDMPFAQKIVCLDDESDKCFGVQLAAAEAKMTYVYYPYCDPTVVQSTLDARIVVIDGKYGRSYGMSGEMVNGPECVLLYHQAHFTGIIVPNSGNKDLNNAMINNAHDNGLRVFAVGPVSPIYSSLKLSIEAIIGMLG